MRGLSWQSAGHAVLAAVLLLLALGPVASIAQGAAADPPPVNLAREVEQAPPSPRRWPWAAGLASGLAITLALAWRLTRSRRRGAPHGPPAAADGRTGDDPDVAPRRPEAREDAAWPERPGWRDLPLDCDALLAAEGRLGDGRKFRAFCPVDRSELRLRLGRAGCELVIDSPGVSPVHARLEGSGERWWLSDAGSRHGSHVGRFPCQAGETVGLGPGDPIRLADARFTLRLLTEDAS